MILYVAGQLTVSGGTNAIVEYIGPGARSISATGKATITNMGAELGATTSMFPADERMATYLRATGREFHGAADARQSRPAGAGRRSRGQSRGLLRPGDQARSEHARTARGRTAFARPRPSGIQACLRDRGPRQRFRRCDLCGLDRKLHQLVLRRHEPRRRHRRAGDGARHQGRRAAAGDARLGSRCVPPSSATGRCNRSRTSTQPCWRMPAARASDNGAGRAKQRTHPTQSSPRTTATFRGEMTASPTTMNFIASPELVTAFALAGRLSFNPMQDTLTGSDGQPFKLDAPTPAPEVPAKNFAPGRAAYIAPGETGRRHRAEDQRQQRAAPAPGAMAGLGRRRFSQHAGSAQERGARPRPITFRRPAHGFVTGATSTNSATTCSWARPMPLPARRATARTSLSGEADQSFAKIARDYKSRGVRWVVVGDFNYGEGSSREHAALSPRLLGGVAVIARSFARIRESNLKKQGLLALTFQHPDDYERIREDDRIDLVGLAELSPGRPVTCIVRHADRTTETLALVHSFSAASARVVPGRFGFELVSCRIASSSPAGLTAVPDASRSRSWRREPAAGTRSGSRTGRRRARPSRSAARRRS